MLLVPLSPKKMNQCYAIYRKLKSIRTNKVLPFLPLSIFLKMNGLLTRQSKKSLKSKVMISTKALEIRSNGNKAKISQSKSSRKRIKRRNKPKPKLFENNHSSIFSELLSLAMIQTKKKRLEKNRKQKSNSLNSNMKSPIISMKMLFLALSNTI